MNKAASLRLLYFTKLAALPILGDTYIKKSFEGGNFIIGEAKQDMQVARVFGDSGKEGSFFGMTVPNNSIEAERMYNLAEYGNNATQLTTVTIKKGTQIAVGNVEGGTGIQIYLPMDLQKGKAIYSNVSTLLH